MLAAYFGFVATGIRCLNAARVHGLRLGPFLGRGFLAVLLLLGAIRLGENTVKGLKAATAYPPPWNVVRARMLDQLNQGSDKHLIIVKYSPTHNVHEEWVYNTPDIDRQNVILARSMGDEADRLLMQHYPDRRFWLLELGASSATVALKPISNK